MTGDEVRALRAENPLSDLDALLGLEDLELAHCVAAANVIYGGVAEATKPQSRGGRIRKILRLRAEFSDMTIKQRAMIKVDDREDAYGR